MEKIGFIGAGNMSLAILGGVLNKSETSAANVWVSNRTKPALDKFSNLYPGINVTLDSCEVAENSDLLILAVKPHVICSVIEQVRAHLKPGATIVSIAAGLSIATMEQAFGKDIKLIRCMPNTPSLVGEGMNVLCGNDSVLPEDLDEVEALFSTFGQVEIIPENLFDAVTGISGCGPAYVFMFMEALADGGVLEGIPRAQAYKLAAQTVLGAAKMLLETGKHPGELKDMVTSPGGVTIEAVASLENDGLRPAVINAVRTCADKSRRMGKK